MSHYFVGSQYYEWWLREPSGNLDFSDSLPPKWLVESGEVMLCFTVWVDGHGVKERHYAYIDPKTGELPRTFEECDGDSRWDPESIPVPDRYHDELERVS